MRAWVVYPVALLALLGCTNPGVVPLSPGVFMIFREDRGGIFGNTARMKATVIQEANAFAAARGKVAIPVSSKETPLAPLRCATFEYQFRLVDPDSPEARSTTTLTPVEPLKRVETKDTTTKPVDVTAELLKLGELRDKKIITEEEFQAQKKKLLEKY